MELLTKYGVIKIYANTIEDEAYSQIVQFANSVLGENAHVRIMPDAHLGKGVVIGTTMLLTDKVCPNLVGVDIGCGVDLIKTNIDFSERLEELDTIIRTYVPFGSNTHDTEQPFSSFTKLRCWNFLKKEAKETALHSLGSLGGGNHFIEAYKDGYLSVHSGSRNIGLTVAKYYQKAAEKQVSQRMHELKLVALENIPPKQRESWLVEQQSTVRINTSLAYLTGELMNDYLYDMAIIQNFAQENRTSILQVIVSKMGGKILSKIASTHNYIDIESKILRKGAISARAGEELVIPLNMRDGLLICVGKGNPEWNYSAPHGAGRLYSRKRAKELFKFEEYVETMRDIFSTCVVPATIDEAPFAYKDWQEIAECIEPTVEIKQRIVPIYNFKACE